MAPGEDAEPSRTIEVVDSGAEEIPKADFVVVSAVEFEAASGADGKEVSEILEDREVEAAVEAVAGELTELITWSLEKNKIEKKERKKTRQRRRRVVDQQVCRLVYLWQSA